MERKIFNLLLYTFRSKERIYNFSVSRLVSDWHYFSVCHSGLPAKSQKLPDNKKEHLQLCDIKFNIQNYVGSEHDVL